MNAPDAGPNAEATEAWNTVLFDKFCRFRHVLVEGFSSHSKTALARHLPRKGARVLDVGCGFGDATLTIGEMIGDGEAVGVDVSERFIESARKDATDARAKNVRFGVADVQTGDLGGPFDHVFSR